MQFLNEQGQAVILKRATTLPGYEITLAAETTIESSVNNPFFKGLNILQLPKKLKGFRDNADLKMLLQPQALNAGIKLELADNEYAVFEPNKDLVTNKHLTLVHRAFGNGEMVQPLFINFGVKNAKLPAGTVIGTLMVLETK